MNKNMILYGVGLVIDIILGLKTLTGYFAFDKDFKDFVTAMKLPCSEHLLTLKHFKQLEPHSFQLIPYSQKIRKLQTLKTNYIF